MVETAKDTTQGIKTNRLLKVAQCNSSIRDKGIKDQIIKFFIFGCFFCKPKQNNKLNRALYCTRRTNISIIQNTNLQLIINNGSENELSLS